MPFRIVDTGYGNLIVHDEDYEFVLVTHGCNCCGNKLAIEFYDNDRGDLTLCPQCLKALAQLVEQFESEES